MAPGADLPRLDYNFRHCHHGREMRQIRNSITITFVFCSFLFSSTGCSFFRPVHDADPYLRQQVVAIALEYKGAPYRYGGASARGFDCAGYVQFVFRQAGLDVPRTVSRQFSAGHEIARENPGKGDVVFFTKRALFNVLAPPSHVGIYIGGNRFIHAPSSGKTVRIDSLANLHWKRRYKGARNLFYPN